MDWWRGRRSFIARLSRGLRHRRREPRSQSKLGCIILCEIALEPVPNAGDKAGGLDGGAGLNSERQHLSAAGLVEQRKIFHNLEPGVLYVHGGKCPVTFGLEQICEDGAQLGNGGLGLALTTTVGTL